MKLFFSLVQVMSFFLLVGYVYCKSPAFRPWRAEALGRRDLAILYGLFSAISVAGTYLGLPVKDALANARAIGPVLAGLVGGPLLGGAVGLTGGVHRFVVGPRFTDLACGLSTAVEGLLAGLAHLLVVRRWGREATLSPAVAFGTTAAAEVVQMAIILAVARPFERALSLVETIALPMIAANAVGAALFMSIIRDRRRTADQVGAASSAKALRMAQRALALLARGFDRSVAAELASIIHEETGVAAVAVTDAENVLAFVGEGSDHHKGFGPIRSDLTRRAIARSEVTFADGEHEPYQCPTAKDCPLRSVLVVPLRIDTEVLGTIKLYERAHAPFLQVNRTLGEGLTALIASQLLRARYQRLTMDAKLELAQAQVKPHFLFNSLATIKAIARKDPERARDLIGYLSEFFRLILKRSSDVATLKEELEHVRAYLEIEKARFEDHLSVEEDVDPALLELKLPVLALQPLVENAIKHGVAEMLTPGTARIRAYRTGDAAMIDVEDDAGLFDPARRAGDGHGMWLVETRIRNLSGGGAALSVFCVPQKLTRVSIQLPLAGRRT